VIGIALAGAAYLLLRDDSAAPIEGKPQIITIRFEPDPVDIGAEVTLIWEVQGAESVAIPPLVGDLDPDSGKFSFVATRDVMDNLQFVATNLNGQTVLLLVRYEDDPRVPTVTS
jgi:hypothetical protein